jgi:hypothetical protein
MNSSRTSVLLGIVSVLAAGCAQAPTLVRESDGAHVPERAGTPYPRFDGGHMLGSGAAVDSSSTSAASAMSAPAAGDTTGRGGSMLGSGA